MGRVTDFLARYQYWILGVAVALYVLGGGVAAAPRPEVLGGLLGSAIAATLWVAIAVCLRRAFGRLRSTAAEVRG